jgi:A/G-specific adenine glycosylase
MEKWFSEALIAWYRQNKRDLPWRREKDAYKIWLSEIILQQTQVAQGLNYYLKFSESYPTISHLANAKEDEIMKLWQGLGYYSRARNLHATAKTIKHTFKGVFPSNYQDIKALKGVGDYTAAAIASFAYNLPYAVVDGNVYRVLSRIFGVRTPIDSTEGKKQFQKLADELLDEKNPALNNQAIMEFGSQFCKPANPDCENCIFKNKCYAFKSSSIAALPVKGKKTKVRDRHFNYLVIVDKQGDILLNKRKGGDIWQGLYEFKLIETSNDISTEMLLKSKNFKSVCKSGFDLKHVSKSYKHILSHQHLYAKFYVIKMRTTVVSKQAGAQQTKSSVNKLSTYAFPRLIGKFLDDCDLKEML